MINIVEANSTTYDDLAARQPLDCASSQAYVVKHNDGIGVIHASDECVLVVSIERLDNGQVAENALLRLQLIGRNEIGYDDLFLICHWHW